MSKFLRATAKVILYKSKSLKDGKHPVMLKVTFKGKRKYYTTGLNMSIDEYAKLNSDKRLTKAQSDLQTQLKGLEVKAQTLINRVIEDSRSFTFIQFEKKFFVKVSNTDVFHLFDQRIYHYERKGSFSTRDSFKCAKAHMKEYVGSKKLSLEDITPDFLIQYEKAYPKLSPNTLGIYEKNLRVIFNLAIKEGLISPELNPFINHKIPYRPGVKKALKKEDLIKILNYKSIKYSHEWLSQKIYIFSYLCNGMNLKDMINLRWTDIKEGRIYFIRSKTINTSSAPRIQSIKVTPELQVIIDDLKHYKTAASDYIFPVLQQGMTEEKQYRRKNDFVGVINDNLRNISIKLDLKKDFTFYSARHSWATILKRAGISVEVISEGMSHSSIRVTENYLDSFGDDQLDEANRNLL